MKDRYRESRALFERASKVIPGGIYGSKARAFLFSVPTRTTLTGQRDPWMWDVDGNDSSTISAALVSDSGIRQRKR